MTHWFCCLLFVLFLSCLPFCRHIVAKIPMLTTEIRRKQTPEIKQVRHPARGDLDPETHLIPFRFTSLIAPDATHRPVGAQHRQIHTSKNHNRIKVEVGRKMTEILSRSARGCCFVIIFIQIPAIIAATN